MDFALIGGDLVDPLSQCGSRGASRCSIYRQRIGACRRNAPYSQWEHMVASKSPAPALKSRAIRILYVEDDEDTLSAMVRLLIRRGYHVSPARSIAEALSLAASVRFDILLTDIRLPDGNGDALLPKVRLRGPIKGIAVTGHDSPEVIRRIAAAGFEHYLVKPIAFEVLADVLTSVRDASLHDR
jgi:CheY-like chemotaxis protein